MQDDLLKPSADQVLGVTALTRQIKTLLEGSFRRLWVQGEVSNLRRQSSGHVYFSLKDAGSQLPCVLFARDAARQSFELRDGMEVQLFGDLSLYEPYGRYQMIAKIAIESGLGRLQIEFERLKRKLAAEGLFDRERKQALPALPTRIAVVTSPTGAAIRDFLRILKRRGFRGEVIIFPARVQGKEASGEIARMLQHAAASTPAFDLAVVTRGGGSIEDLWAFNEEPLARAVAACPLPVISAVGHEIDTVLTDYAADKRAETPSGAAELISSLYLEAVQRLENAAQSLQDCADASLTERLQQLRELKARMDIIAPARQVEHRGMQLDDLENRLRNALKDRWSNERNALSNLVNRLQAHHPRIRIRLAQQSMLNANNRLKLATSHALKQQAEQIDGLGKRLTNGSLNATLRRGYAILSQTGGPILTSAEATRSSHTVTARFHDGNVDLKVEE